MKNRKIVIFILIITFLLSSYSFGDNLESDIYVNPKIFNANIVINGYGFDNSLSENPILNYNGVLYLPLTLPIMDSLGFKLTLNDNQNFNLERVDFCKLYDEVKHKSFDKINIGTVRAKIYDKEMVINGKKKNLEGDLQKIIFYNNKLYIPLNSENVKNELELEIKWDDEKNFVINRNNDFKTSGIIDFKIKNKNKKEIENIKNELYKMIEIIKNNNQKKEFNNQTEYYYDLEDVEYTHVIWDNGDNMTLKEPREGLSKVLYNYKEEGQDYIGYYREGEFFGKGQYVFNDGRQSEISDFSDKKDEYEGNVKIEYSDKINENKFSLPVLVVMSEFDDVRFSSEEGDWKERIFGNGENDLTGYYNEISNGKIKFIPVIEKNGEINDGIIRIKLDENHPNFGEENSQNYTIIQKSLEKIDSDIDFSIYDRNDNGVIEEKEIVIINIVAGYESSRDVPVFGKSIWAHKGEIVDGNHVLDGVMIASYCQIGELVNENGKSEPANMNVLAHEVGHILGLPDLYDTDQTSQGLGPFSLMAEGTNNNIVGKKRGSIIPEFDPWSKIKLGIIKPTLITESGEYSLYSKSSGRYNILKIQTPNPDEYFLVENKLLDGRDFTIASATEKKGGILIYHIDNSVINDKYFENEINDNEDHKGVDLEDADQIEVKVNTLDTDNYSEYINPFYTVRGYSKFNENTLPNSNLYNEDLSGISIEVLSDGLESRIKIEKEVFID